MRGSARKSGVFAAAVAVLIGGALTLVSLIANPAGISTLSWGVISVLTIIGVVVFGIYYPPGRGESRLRKAADQFPFGVVIYNQDLTIRFANRFAQTVYDKPLRALIGRRDSELLGKEAVQMFSGDLEQVLAAGTARSSEARLENAGKRQMFMMTFAPVGERGEEGNEVLSVWIETSKIDEITERLERVNRTLSTLIEADRALVGCDREDELLKRFCDTLTDKGEYPAAWIGARNSDGTVVPVTSSGCSLSDLKSITFRWNETTKDELPIAAAIREGQPHVARHGDESNPHAAELLERFGVKSCAGLPIRLDEEVPFALCLGGATEHCFDPEEMKLLEQMAADLAFGISSVRARQRLARQEQVVTGLLAMSQRTMETNEQTILDEAVELAVEATGSRFGCLQLMDEDSASFRRGSCSKHAHDNVELKAGECRLFPNEPGCSDCVLLHETDSSHETKVTTCETTGIGQRVDASVLEHGQVKARIAVADKSSDYDEADIQILQLVVENLWKTLGRRRSELQLTKQQRLLSRAERLAHLGTWKFEALTGEISWSDETYRIHGWPHDAKVTREKLEEMILPDDREQVRRTVACMVETERPCDLEYQIALPNGDLRHLQVRGEAVKDAEGRFKGIGGTVLDITAQKREEDKNHDFERMLVTFLDNLPAVITLKNEKLEHVYGNTAALKLFHVDSDHFVGSTDTTFLQRDTAECLHAVERSALNTRNPVMTPDIQVGNNGDARHLRGVCFPVVLPDGRVQVGMYATDVTELEALTAKSTLLQSALEAAANGVVITDTKGNIEWVNRAFTNITGYSAEEVIGNTPKILKSGHHDPNFYKKMWATLKRGEVWNGELKNRRKDGTIYDEQMTITPVRDAAGTIEHYIAIKLDITERHELENKLLRSQRMESIGLLAGGVAHDLNNILAPIVMGVDLLRETDLPPAEKHEFLDSIAQGCERGTAIIRQVLTFARGVEGDRVIVQTRHQVKDIVKMARETFPKDITISMNVANNLWPVLGDPTQLHQVLLNFSVNARDAMPHGGRLEVIGENVELKESRTFQGFEIQPGRYSRLTVRDSGTGMPAEVLDRIFEPFFTTKEQGKGTGLGLPTVLGIVKSHQGLVEYETAPGKGTSAIVWLPAAESSEEGRQKPQSTPPQGHGETVLLVDDEPDVRHMTSIMLKKSNYLVLEAEDGAAAVASFAVHRDKIDLVLTDIMMPVMDGVALAHALRKMDSNVTIVGSSGFVGGGDRGDRIEDLKRAGVKTLLQKPYSPRELLETLAEELKNKDEVATAG